ncbi:MAG: PqqD family protein [Gemmatimonadales bacterium]|nr:PqqD family protein [Gemmatimonadales bacterium]
MILFGKFGSKKLRDLDFSSLIPAVEVAHDHGGNAGDVVLLVPRFRDPIFGRLIQPRLPAHKQYIKIPLDCRGSFIWALIDGKRSILDLSRDFSEEFPEDSEQASKRISAYLHRMYENRFIRFVNLD